MCDPAERNGIKAVVVDKPSLAQMGRTLGNTLPANELSLLVYAPVTQVVAPIFALEHLVKQLRFC